MELIKVSIIHKINYGTFTMLIGKRIRVILNPEYETEIFNLVLIFKDI